jgi:hypothetical protein
VTDRLPATTAPPAGLGRNPKVNGRHPDQNARAVAPRGSPRRTLRRARLSAGFALPGSATRRGQNRALPIVGKSSFGICAALACFQIRAQFADSNASPKTDLPGGWNSIPAPTVLHAHSRCVTFTNPPTLTISTTRRLGIGRLYNHHPCDDLEPLPDIPNPYREAALRHLALIYVVDDYITSAKDARFAVIVVAITLGWPSTRGMTAPEIASQIGCSPLTITRACARFREMAGLAGAAVFDPFGPVPVSLRIREAKSPTVGESLQV